MKIGIYLSSSPSSGGIFQYCLTILSALEKEVKKSDTIYVIYTDKVWESYLSNFTFNCIYVKKSFAFSNFLKLLVLLRINNISLISKYLKIIKVLDSHNFDICIFPSQDPESVFHINTLIIGTIHDLMHRYERSFPESAKGVRYYYREAFYSSLVKNANKILVDSEYGKKQVIESYNVFHPDKIIPLPYTYPSYLMDIKKLTNEFFINKLPEKYIFYPAQFWKHKNHINLLSAIKILKDKNIRINLVLSGGKKNNYEEIKITVAKLELEKQIFFTGYISNEEIAYLYSNTIALVMPTYYGPTNIPPLEAFYMNCPVAVSNVYGMPEQLQNAALLFDPSDVNAIAEVIQKLWLQENLRNELKTKGQKVIEMWNPNFFAKRLINLIYEN